MKYAPYSIKIESGFHYIPRSPQDLKILKYMYYILEILAFLFCIYLIKFKTIFKCVLLFIVISFIAYIVYQMLIQPIKVIDYNELVLLEQIKTKVVGVTFPSVLDKNSKRQEIIKDYCTRDTKLRLMPFLYKGERANYVVVDHINTDIGCLKADLSKELYRKYPNCKIQVQIIEITGGEGRQSFGCNIELNVYGKQTFD